MGVSSIRELEIGRRWPVGRTGWDGKTFGRDATIRLSGQDTGEPQLRPQEVSLLSLRHVGKQCSSERADDETKVPTHPRRPASTGKQHRDASKLTLPRPPKAIRKTQDKRDDIKRCLVLFEAVRKFS